MQPGIRYVHVLDLILSLNSIESLDYRIIISSIFVLFCFIFGFVFFYGARNLNPTPYQANYMGQKIHMDQNEKLAMFGVTHVIAIDGFSKKDVGHSTMPFKNNLSIYTDVFK